MFKPILTFLKHFFLVLFIMLMGAVAALLPLQHKLVEQADLTIACAQTLTEAQLMVIGAAAAADSAHREAIKSRDQAQTCLRQYLIAYGTCGLQDKE